MKITYKHFRVDRETGQLKPYTRPHKLPDGTRIERPFEPAERGGETRCTIEDGVYIANGLAECSVKDAFSYRLGRTISRGRALLILQAMKGAKHAKV